ncbi:hypothetical protein DPMN_120052 [Dreissena polymorpha]|uniref:Myb/SANT-like DNA-binding domain-containing protein n=1 Tax=Dreissena polymorpha TaxID=45954 RepID=A0A9D4GMR9_DREPO|nr:hypothetical protein DPMN_120052 [Dreissena polymorpha]
MQRSVCTPLCAGTPVTAVGISWSHLSLCLFCLGCDRTAAAKEEKSVAQTERSDESRPACRPNFEVLGQGAYARGTITSSVAPVRFLRCVALSQKEKSGRSVVPPTSSLEDDEDVWCHPDEDSSRCQRISKATKNALWVSVAENFNARAQFRREQFILEKKWENLQRDHRNLYMDYQREISLTGRGPIGRTLSVLKEAVIDVIGKQSAAVVGAAEAAYDSTLTSLMLPQQFDLCDSHTTPNRNSNLNASDSGLHHTVSLMYVGGRHIGFGTTLENKMEAPS